MKAIKVQYKPATNTQGSYWKATTKDSQGIIHKYKNAYNYAKSEFENAKEAFNGLIAITEWENVEMTGWGVYDNDYYFTIN